MKKGEKNKKMRIAKLVFFIFLISIIAFGCSPKKQELSGVAGLGLEGEDKDMIVQTITSPEVTEPQPAPQQSPAQSVQPAPIEVSPVETTVAIPLPSEGVEKNKQIQIALKNANLYFGEIDGKIGPLTRKAIEEFQKMKNLKVDGKVGPITWGELQKYLNIQPTPTEKSNLGAKKKR